MDLGATGEFPEGKLGKHDEGQLKMAIGEKDGKLVFDFGKSVRWIGMPPNQAIDFALNIINHAKTIMEKR